MANKHENLTSLFTDIADAIRAKTGGDTLTWDGNTEGLEASGDAYKVSDATPSINDFANGCSVVSLNGTTKEFTSDDLEVMDTGMGVTVIVSRLGEFMIASGDLQLGDGTIAKKGTYFLHAGKATTVSLTIPGYTGFSSKIIADNFPEAIAAIDTQENLDAELSDQDTKIAELQAALQGKAAVASEDLSAEMTAQDEAIASQDDLIAQIATALEGKTVGGGGTSVETVTGDLSRFGTDYSITYENGAGNSCFIDRGFVPDSIEVRKGSLLTIFAQDALDGLGSGNEYVIGDLDYRSSNGVNLVSQLLSSDIIFAAVLQITSDFSIYPISKW